jgi:hypothetical protein
MTLKIDSGDSSEELRKVIRVNKVRNGFFRGFDFDESEG